mgnify:CR=1 FL=1|tara:strand:+ start:54 stop:278 length:225 start_codon:yes stop_codon:yes gene_type:complete
MKPFTSKHCAQYLTKESPLNQTGTFAPTESTGDKKKKEDEVAKKNKGKTKEKFPPCPEGKKRIFGMGGSKCIDK